jgi:hypothetical protein
MVSNPDQLSREKALCFLWEHVPERLISDTPLRAVVLPRVNGTAPAATVPGDPSEALKALAPSTVLLAPSYGEATLAALAALVRHVPIYELHTGPDVASVPDAIEEILVR